LGLLIGWWLCGRCKCKGTKDTGTTVNTNTSSLKSNAEVSTPKVAATAATASAATAATTTAKPAKATAKKVVADTDAVDVSDDWKPKGFTSRPSDADELKRIKGIGPVIEKTLNGLGVYQFSQIADFTKDNISWVENYLAFPGRIEREDWIAQAKDLAAGKETAFSKRVDKGDLNY